MPADQVLATRRRVLRLAAGACAAGMAGEARAAGTTISLAHLETAKAMLALLDQTKATFERAHPGDHVSQLYLENAAYKAKLTTMLQSSDRPDIIYSWGRGTLDAQVEAGVIRDVTATVQGWHEDFVPVALDAFRIDGKLYGAPFLVSGVGFFCNKPLLQKAGVDIDGVRRWDDFTKTVAKLKAAGIVPVTVGGGEKWPLHFYWAFLSLRLGGKAAFEAARAGNDGGFTAPVFVEAARMLQGLAKSGAFQPGFAGTAAPESYGQFGDGKAAMILMGNWITAAQSTNAGNGKGLSQDEVGFLRFPTVTDGKGDPKDTFGGVNGWAVTKSAPALALDYLHDLADPEFERQLATNNIFIPAVKGMSDLLTDPVLREVSNEIEGSPFHLLFLDQTLGPSVGSVVNDVSLGLATGALTPMAAVKQIEDARQAEAL